MATSTSDGTPVDDDGARGGEATRQRLMAAGMGVLAERGYHASRVDDVCAAAEVSHGTFYLYFGNKDALVLALAERCAEELGGLVTRLGDVEAGPAGRARVRAWLGDFVQLYRSYGVVIRSWVEQAASPELVRLGVSTLGSLSEVLVERVRRSHPADAELRVAALIAVMERFTYLAVTRDLGEEDHVLDTAATVIHRAFFAEPAA